MLVSVLCFLPQIDCWWPTHRCKCYQISQIHVGQKDILLSLTADGVGWAQSGLANARYWVRNDCQAIDMGTNTAMRWHAASYWVKRAYLGKLFQSSSEMLLWDVVSNLQNACASSLLPSTNWLLVANPQVQMLLNITNSCWPKGYSVVTDSRWGRLSSVLAGESLVLGLKPVSDCNDICVWHL